LHLVLRYRINVMVGRLGWRLAAERSRMTDQLDWAAVDACMLPTAERPSRVAEFDALFAERLVGVERLSPTRARLELLSGDETVALAADLTERETSCCSFFSFAVSAAHDATTIEVGVPASRADVLEAWLARAESHRGGVR
jgi:hypothetical protein